VTLVNEDCSKNITKSCHHSLFILSLVHFLSLPSLEKYHYFSSSKANSGWSSFVRKSLLQSEKDKFLKERQLTLIITLTVPDAAHVARFFHRVLVLVTGPFPLPPCCTPYITELNEEAMKRDFDYAAAAFRSLTQLARYRGFSSYLVPYYFSLSLSLSFWFVIVQQTMNC
jgi:hypothetical protein